MSRYIYSEPLYSHSFDYEFHRKNTIPHRELGLGCDSKSSPRREIASNRDLKSFPHREIASNLDLKSFPNRELGKVRIITKQPTSTSQNIFLVFSKPDYIQTIQKSGILYNSGDKISYNQKTCAEANKIELQELLKPKTDTAI